MWWSPMLAPAACTRTSTSSSPRSGRATCSNVSTSGVPYCRCTIALIVVLALAGFVVPAVAGAGAVVLTVVTGVGIAFLWSTAYMAFSSGGRQRVARLAYTV